MLKDAKLTCVSLGRHIVFNGLINYECLCAHACLCATTYGSFSARYDAVKDFLASHLEVQETIMQI